MLSQQNIKISLKIKYYFHLILIGVFFLFTIISHAQSQKFKVILDAGHGGKDPGTLGKASYKNSYESDIALKVTLNIGKLLENNSEFKTIFTRKTDDFIPLHKRGKIANKADADLFISIHCNAASSNAYGTTTYVLGVDKSAKNLELSKRENDVILLEDDHEKNYDYDPNSEEFMIGLTLMQEDYQDKSIEFAQIVQNKFVSVAKRKNRGVNQGNLAVLYDSYMPSVLIEIGFLSNKIEEKFLHTKTGQQKIARAIYQAILTYKKRIDNNSIDEHIIANEVSNNNTEVYTNTTSNHYYKVQIAMSKKKIKLKAYNFKGLENVTRKKVGNLYKYFYGQANTIIEAKKIKTKVRKIGYPDAFIKRLSGKTEVIKESNEPETPTIVNNEFYYSVQFEYGQKKELKSYNFKGLKNVTRMKFGKFYKYFYGSTSDLIEAKKIQKELIKLGYKDAFVKKLKGTKATTNPIVTNNKDKNDTRIIKDITFKVQITSGKKKIEAKAYNFKGLKNIERIKIGTFYKYYYGKTNDYNLIYKMQKDAIKKGYKDATIVAIKNNKLVSVSSVLQ